MKTCLPLALLMIALPLAAAAQTAAPKPRLRPTAAEQQAPPAPIPRPRPPRAAKAAEPDAPAPPPPQGEEPRGWSAAAIAAGRAECKTLLAGLDIEYRALDAIGREGGCGAPAPVEVTRIAGVALSPPATQTCAMAAAMAAWVAEDVLPAARRHLGTEITEIRTATSYACRRRNNASSGKLSEHGKANALDMSGFTFGRKEGVTVKEKGGWGQGLLAAVGLSKDGAFLEDIRKSACTHFTTVLGPGSDPYHGDHFHVDVLQRRGGYRICQ